MSDKDVVITTDAAGELPDDVVRLNEITARAMLEERRRLAREAEDARRAALEEISPECERLVVRADDPTVRLQIQVLAGERGIRTEDLPDSLKERCGHQLNRHDPCSGCRCPGFVDAEGRGAEEASAALVAAHPALFPEASS